MIKLKFRVFISFQIMMKWANRVPKKPCLNLQDQEENRSLKEALTTLIRSLFQSLVDGFSKIILLSSSMLSNLNTKPLKAQELTFLSYWLLSNLLCLSKNKICFLHISKKKFLQKLPNTNDKLRTHRWKIWSIFARIKSPIWNFPFKLLNYIFKETLTNRFNASTKKIKSPLSRNSIMNKP